VQDAGDSDAIIRDAIKNHPPVEGWGHCEVTQIAEFLGTKPGARVHFRKIDQQIKGLKGRIQKGPRRHVIVAPDVIPTFNQIVIYFGRCLPFHFFKSP